MEDANLYRCWVFFSVGTSWYNFLPMQIEKKFIVSIICTTPNWMSCNQLKYTNEARPCLGFSFVKTLALFPCNFEKVQTGCSQG